MPEKVIIVHPYQQVTQLILILKGYKSKVNNT